MKFKNLTKTHRKHFNAATYLRMAQVQSLISPHQQMLMPVCLQNIDNCPDVGSKISQPCRKSMSEMFDIVTSGVAWGGEEKQAPQKWFGIMGRLFEIVQAAEHCRFKSDLAPSDFKPQNGHNMRLYNNEWIWIKVRNQSCDELVTVMVIAA